MNLLCGIWQREHPVGICADTVSESPSIFMCFKSLRKSRSESLGVPDKMAADGGLLASLIVNCVLITAAVPMADKTQTSSLKFNRGQNYLSFFDSIVLLKKKTHEMLVIS